jgi:glutathione S-transferase
MKLYGSYTSPYVRHCRIVLLETEQKAQFISTDQTQSFTLSPTKRVPFLQTDSLTLSDSASIIRYLRESAGQSFCADIQAFDLFCFINTLLDSSANVFYLEKSGLQLQTNDYTLRQQSRIQQGLEILEAGTLATSLAEIKQQDHWLRLACYLDWALFRKRINLNDKPRLQAFLCLANSYEPYASTYPHE